MTIVCSRCDGPHIRSECPLEPKTIVGPCQNTDREIWRGPDEGAGDFYADSLHITKEGALGINCGGFVYVKPIREWFRLAGGKFPTLSDSPQGSEEAK